MIYNATVSDLIRMLSLVKTYAQHEPTQGTGEEGFRDCGVEGFRPEIPKSSNPQIPK